MEEDRGRREKEKREGGEKGRQGQKKYRESRKTIQRDEKERIVGHFEIQLVEQS